MIRKLLNFTYKIGREKNCRGTPDDILIGVKEA
jgi:hypothetical protein